MKRRRFFPFVFSVVFCSFCFAQTATINLYGRVLGESLQPLQDVTVLLKTGALTDVTDNLGMYSLTNQSNVLVHRFSVQRQKIEFVNKNAMVFSCAGMNVPVTVDVFDANGRRIGSPLNSRVSAGTHTVALSSRGTGTMSGGVLFISVKIGDTRTVFKGVYLNGLFIPSGASETVRDPHEAGSLAKAMMDAARDSVVVSKAGYQTVTVPVFALINELPDIILPASATSTVFQQWFAGTGTIFNISTRDSVRLPLYRRIHVVLFPEGYTLSEINSGKYEADMKRWFNEVFNFEPLVFFKQAFVVWKFPAVSNQYINESGLQADTYFKITVANWSVSSVAGCVPVVWNLIPKFPYAPQRFYPSGGYPGNRAKNLITQFLLYQQSYGRSSFSGLTTQLPNPANSSQRLDAPFALDQHHEFMHAFAYLMDEYYDSGFGPLSDNTLTNTSAYLTNVVSSNLASQVPWRHLLKGGTYNPDTDSLVGAFGTNKRFHPEFKCLLNGAHDNSVLYGGDNNLRVTNRLCNFCREITAFRLYERTGVLDTVATSLQTWDNSYRQAFYLKFGFSVPSVVPQKNSLGQPWFTPCQ